MKKRRSIRPVTKERYDALFQLTNGTFRVPIKERTIEQRRAVLQFYRAKDQFSVRGGLLYRLDKKVLLSSDIEKVVKQTFDNIQGCGSRALKIVISRKYTGISQKRVLKCLKKNKMYRKMFARFTNKIPMRSVKALKVGERWQIDLVQMRSDSVQWKGKTYMYILTVVDVHSRYMITRPLRTKSSKEVARKMSSIFMEYGSPQIIQCDNGNEFKGEFENLVQRHKIKVIRGRPYHPQSQGKCERSHRSLRKKIQFMASKKPMNWVKFLSKATLSLNSTPKEVLGYNTPFDVFFGRATANMMSKVATASDRCAERNAKYSSKTTPPPSIYKVGQNVLARYPFQKSRVPTRRCVLEARILERNLKSYRYKIEFECPKTAVKTSAWVSVENLTSTLASKKQTVYNKHKKKFYIPVTKADRIENFKNMHIHVSYDPYGDGNCQFSAVAHQLSQFRLYRTHQCLRSDAVEHMEKNRAEYEHFVSGDFDLYLSSMHNNGTYGDHLTLLSLSREYNLQIMVFSAAGLDYSTIVSNDGTFQSDINTLTLGYFPEGNGEHYISVNVDSETFRSLADQYMHDTLETMPPTKPTVSSNKQDMQPELSGDESAGIVNDIPSTESRKDDIVDDDGEDSMCASHPVLPDLVMEKIILMCIESNPEMIFSLNKVCQFFSTIIQKNGYKYPTLYLSSSVLKSVPEVLSVRKMIRLFGRNSGLMLEVRHILKPYGPKWINAWLLLNPLPNNWYEVNNVFWN